MLCLLFLLPHAALACWHLYDQLVVAPELGVIGGADGPTVIVTTSTAAAFWSWLQPLLLTAAALGVLFTSSITRAGSMFPAMDSTMFPGL